MPSTLAHRRPVARRGREGTGAHAMPLGTIIHAVAGIMVLGAAFAMDEAVSIGSALGVMLLINAVARYFVARRA